MEEWVDTTRIAWPEVAGLSLWILGRGAVTTAIVGAALW